MAILYIISVKDLDKFKLILGQGGLSVKVDYYWAQNIEQCKKSIRISVFHIRYIV